MRSVVTKRCFALFVPLEPPSEPLLEDLKDLEVSCSPNKFELYPGTTPFSAF